MISRQLVTHFLSRSFFSASPEFVCQNCQKCQTTRGAKKSVKSVNFAVWGGCSSSMSCVGYRQPGICLSKLSKVSSDPGGEKERQKRQFCSLQFHVLCRLQAARNLSVKTVKSVKRPGGRKRASKASLLLSLGRVFQFHVLCRLQAARNLPVKTVKSVKRPGSEKERQKRQFCSLWGGCSSSMFCVGYRPRFETWVRIRHFAGLSILQCAGRSSSNLWCSKMLAKSLQTALRGPPASNFAGLRLANQHLQASEAFWQLAALPSRF